MQSRWGWTESVGLVCVSAANFAVSFRGRGETSTRDISIIQREIHSFLSFLHLLNELAARVTFKPAISPVTRISLSLFLRLYFSLGEILAAEKTSLRYLSTCRDTDVAIGGADYIALYHSFLFSLSVSLPLSPSLTVHARALIHKFCRGGARVYQNANCQRRRCATEDRFSDFSLQITVRFPGGRARVADDRSRSR